MGDPAGCGPQITCAAWRDRQRQEIAPFFVIADPRLYDDGVPIAEISDPAQASEAFATALPVWPIELAGATELIPGQEKAEFAPCIVDSIRQATEFCLQDQARAVITNPISKAPLYQAGFQFPGHTEYIADLCGKPTDETFLPVMMLVGGGLRVALATIHVPLLQVGEWLTAERLSRVARTTHQALQREFGIEAPRLAFTGLNPHAGEQGTIGREEIELINPVAAALREDGINISAARPADTVFHEARLGDYDAIIAMTHDQGLIPVKTLDMWGGVNTTLGLPIVRTSPDHGTAFDAAAARTCRPDSLIAALKLAHSMSDHRSVYANV
jgi:4-hydroxythreonine-4-phosphate dehydrogenase